MGSLFDRVTGVHTSGMQEIASLKKKNRTLALRSSLFGRESMETYTGNNVKEV